MFLVGAKSNSRVIAANLCHCKMRICSYKWMWDCKRALGSSKMISVAGKTRGTFGSDKTIFLAKKKKKRKKKKSLPLLFAATKLTGNFKIQKRHVASTHPFCYLSAIYCYTNGKAVLSLPSLCCRYKPPTSRFCNCKSELCVCVRACVRACVCVCV